MRPWAAYSSTTRTSSAREAAISTTSWRRWVVCPSVRGTTSSSDGFIAAPQALRYRPQRPGLLPIPENGQGRRLYEQGDRRLPEPGVHRSGTAREPVLGPARQPGVSTRGSGHL